MFIVPLPEKCSVLFEIFLCKVVVFKWKNKGYFAVPKNLKLLAVPLFELYENAARYGPVIAAIPPLLSRFKFTCIGK